MNLRSSRPSLAALSILAVLCLLGRGDASAPASAQDQGQIRRGGTLVVTMSSDPVGNFDPMLASDSGSSEVIGNVVEGLYKYDEQLRPVPWLAERVEQPDDVTYVFYLRQGVRFHDGTEMDAEAVKFSVDRVRINPDSPGYPDGQIILESVVLDRYVYKIVLKEPFAPFPSRLTSRLGGVVSSSAVRTLGDAEFNRNPVGTGPFRSVVYELGRSIRVERFDSYWRMGRDGLPLPYLDRVEWQIIRDPLDRLTALQRGQVQIADTPASADWLIQHDPRLVVAHSPNGLGYNGLQLTIDRPPFDNRALRQAVRYAIDREEVNDFWYDGSRAVANGPIPPIFTWAVDPAYHPYSYDPAKAREKLREGGMPDGFEFEVWALDTEEELMELIADQLEDVGIRMRIRVTPLFETVVRRALGRDSNAYWLGFMTGFDPDGAVSRFLPGDFFNIFPYDNPAVTDLILRARRTTDLDTRGSLYKQVVPLIMEDSPYIIFFTNALRFVGSSRVQGWHVGVRATAGYSEYWLAEP